MIYITGDIHGDMSRIVRFCEKMEKSLILHIAIFIFE